MKLEYEMNENTFNSMIRGCREEIESGDYTKEGKEKWSKEIEFILKGESDYFKWVRLINSNIFRLTYGEKSGIRGDKLYVESIYYGKDKPNSYFPILG